MVKLLAETWISSQGKSIALKRELPMLWPMKYLDVFDVSSLMIQNIHQPCVNMVQTCCEYCFLNRPDICSASRALFLHGNCLQVDKWSSIKGHKTESCHRGCSKAWRRSSEGMCFSLLLQCVCTENIAGGTVFVGTVLTASKSVAFCTFVSQVRRFLSLGIWKLFHKSYWNIEFCYLAPMEHWDFCSPNV